MTLTHPERMREYRRRHTLNSDAPIPDFISDAVDSPDVPTTELVGTLTTRLRIADSMYFLACIAEDRAPKNDERLRNVRLPKILIVNDPLCLVANVAEAFGLEPPRIGTVASIITVESLRQIANGDHDRAALARLAFAAIRKPLAPWAALNRRERAALLLNMAIEHRRNRQ